MTETPARLASINHLIEIHDTLDSGLNSVDPNDLAVCMLVSALMVANAEPNPVAREALTLYVIDEAIRKQHGLHMLRQCVGYDFSFTSTIKEHIRVFLSTCPHLEPELRQFDLMCR